MRSFTKDRGFHTAGRTRLSRDQVDLDRELRKDLFEVLDDPDADIGDLHACLAEHFPEETAQLHREVAEDRRGVVRWAKDRRDRRRFAKDFGTENLTGGSSGPEQFERAGSRQGGENLSAADMAFDAQSRRNPSLRNFRARYPGAARIERF